MTEEERKEAKRVRDRVYYQANREARIRYQQSYYRAHEEQVKQQQRERGSKKRASRKEAALEALGGRCLDCDITDVRVLQFHHRDTSTKLFEIPAASGRSEETFWAEVEKCDLVCANHHLIRHWELENGREEG